MAAAREICFYFMMKHFLNHLNCFLDVNFSSDIEKEDKILNHLSECNATVLYSNEKDKEIEDNRIFMQDKESFCLHAMSWVLIRHTGL